MLVVDGDGLPIGFCLASPNRHEVAFAEEPPISFNEPAIFATMEKARSKRGRFGQERQPTASVKIVEPGTIVRKHETYSEHFR